MTPFIFCVLLQSENIDGIMLGDLERAEKAKGLKFPKFPDKNIGNLGVMSRRGEAHPLAMKHRGPFPP